LQVWDESDAKKLGIFSMGSGPNSAGNKPAVSPDAGGFDPSISAALVAVSVFSESWSASTCPTTAAEVMLATKIARRTGRGNIEDSLMGFRN
jgi:hypothetical protein